PSAERGPVLRCALRMFASICFSVAINEDGQLDGCGVTLAGCPALSRAGLQGIDSFLLTRRRLSRCGRLSTLHHELIRNYGLAPCRYVGFRTWLRTGCFSASEQRFLITN